MFITEGSAITQDKKKGKRKKLDTEIKNLPVTLTGSERVMRDGSTLVTMTDLKGKITYANKDFAEISGAEVSELVGKPHSIIRNPAMPRSAFQDFWDTIEAGRPWNGIVKNRATNGDHYFVDANVAPRVENGQIVGYTSVRRKPTRSQIDKAEELYQKILAGKSTFPWSDKKQLSVRTKTIGTLTIVCAVLSVTEVLDIFGKAGSWSHHVTGLAAAVILGFAFYLMRLVLNPIADAAEVANRMATGDLRSAIPHNRNDEVGALQKSLLNMLINTASMIARIKETTEVLASSSKELNEASQSLSAGTQQTSQQSQAIAASATQMNQNIQVISSSAEEMTISIAEVARKASDAARIASEANRTAAETDVVVKELGTNAGDIGKVIETISTIAAQTNLLALNAAIEAAGAGEAGKGFAVVAQEVKELARQSAMASEEIKAKINAIQKSTDTAVGAIQSISAIIKQINEINSAIASAVEEQSITTKEIASNVSQTSTASKEVARNIEGISSASALGAQDASRTSAMSSELTRLADELTRITSQFKV